MYTYIIIHSYLVDPASLFNFTKLNLLSRKTKGYGDEFFYRCDQIKWKSQWLFCEVLYMAGMAHLWNIFVPSEGSITGNNTKLNLSFWHPSQPPPPIKTQVCIGKYYITHPFSLV